MAFDHSPENPNDFALWARDLNPAQPLEVARGREAIQADAVPYVLTAHELLTRDVLPASSAGYVNYDKVSRNPFDAAYLLYQAMQRRGYGIQLTEDSVSLEHGEPVPGMLGVRVHPHDEQAVGLMEQAAQSDEDHELD